MAQKIEITCNRCGEEILSPTMRYHYSAHILKDHSARITLWSIGEPRSSFGQRIDLCPECYDEFVNFMDGKRSDID